MTLTHEEPSYPRYHFSRSNQKKRHNSFRLKTVGETLNKDLLSIDKLSLEKEGVTSVQMVGSPYQFPFKRFLQN